MKIHKNPNLISIIVSFLIIFSSLFTAEIVAGEGEEDGSKNIFSMTEKILDLPEQQENFTFQVASGSFSGNFSPFFFSSGYDGNVVNMTQINLLTTDRLGGIVNNAIEGEIRSYNGTDYLYTGPADTTVVYDELTDTTTYTAQLRQDIQFSDGVPVTADDIIFTYYTFLDPSYNGTNTLNSYPILGLKEYQTQTSSLVYDKYETLFEDIYAADHDHVWTVADAWTQAQQDDVWARFDSAILTETQKIVEYVNTNYMDYAEDYTGYTPEEIMGNEGMEIMFGMVLWGFGEINESGALVTSSTSTVFDLIGSFPTYEDFKNEILATYNWDIQDAFPYESPDGTDVYDEVKNDFICYWGPMDPLMGGQGIPNIAGIVKVDDYTVKVTINGFSSSAAYTILGIPVAPLHYYGDVAKYDYENNEFGFDLGDLSKQESLTATPMGAGPYRFIKYDNDDVHFVANGLFYKGEPKIENIQFKVIATDQIPSAIQQGIIDIAEIYYSADLYEEIKSYNANGEMTGDVITSSMFAIRSYGYIGINADTVNVAGNSSSEASKNLRKAFATIFSVHRDLAIENYYGDGASVINYPISSTSWAAPQPTDDGYQIAFSVDVNGDPIYIYGMTLEDKVAAAEAAALGFFQAAGYTVEDNMITAAPVGAKMSYTGWCPAGGVGDHPNYAIFTSTQESLAKLGMEFVINDPADWNEMLNAIDANEQEIWTMAWGSAIDPDMYQIYHSDNITGQGTGSNYYHVTDTELDQLIMDARVSDDQSYRKAIYKQCFDIIMDWAVEIPVYQRFNAIIYSTQRFNTSTITPDMTAFWGWQNDIEDIDTDFPLFLPLIAH